MYRRVIPRDLFNEAKLLKCLGQLSLAIHDEIDVGKRAVPHCLKVRGDDGKPFKIDQRESDGGLFCSSLIFVAGSMPLILYSSYNSKSPYPLNCESLDYGVFDVFNDDGSLTSEFARYVEKVGNDATDST